MVNKILILYKGEVDEPENGELALSWAHCFSWKTKRLMVHSFPGTRKCLELSSGGVLASRGEVPPGCISNAHWAYESIQPPAIENVALVCQQIWTTQQWPATGLEKVGFHSNPRKGQCQRMFKLLYKCVHFTC